MMDLVLMCWEFFKTGLLSVGGGLATLPFLYAMADKYPWFTRAQLSDMIAVSESTPGPIGVNMSTYAGYMVGGIPGAVLATLFLVLPSIIVVLVVARFLERFSSSRLVKRTLNGLRPASVGLVASAWWGILTIALNFNLTGGLASVLSWKSFGLIAILAVIYSLKNKWHPIIIILLGAVGGVVLGL